MIILISVLIIILFVLLIGFFVWKFKKTKKPPVDKVALFDELFALHDFNPGEVYIINKHLTIALNKRSNRFAIIKNFNPKNLDSAVFIDFPLLCLTKIKQTKMSVELFYLRDSKEETIKISPAKADVKRFLYRILKKVNLSIIEKKHPNLRFDITSSSDWQSTYVWAFSSFKSIFVYYDTEKQFTSHEINLLKTNLTLDIKYSYFEMSIYNINQQLLAYEAEFYDGLYNALIRKIKEKFACILKNMLYYDNNNNVVYLSNGTNSLQVINLETVEEIYYQENKLSFKIIQNDKTINYMVSKELLHQFEDFIINLNLKKIAQNFNYSSDKLINTSQNTKLIVDYTRNRIVYCANLNTLSQFSYFIVAFDNIKDVEYFKSASNIFVRIYLKDDEKLDITCMKSEVAYYILAQIKVILNE